MQFLKQEDPYLYNNLIGSISAIKILKDNTENGVITAEAIKNATGFRDDISSQNKKSTTSQDYAIAQANDTASLTTGITQLLGKGVDAIQSKLKSLDSE
jgi:hypothetical protein